ncbi:hypothetical protein ON010_g15310 [Phytophthora cinnamomi]|nr:hypothetical protein ON010_g15310 [Phytophthora cinnamomi]
MDEDYKLAKEAFVAGLQGTSAREVFLVFAIAPRCYVVPGELMALFGAHAAAGGRGHPAIGRRQLELDGDDPAGVCSDRRAHDDRLHLCRVCSAAAGGGVLAGGHAECAVLVPRQGIHSQALQEGEDESAAREGTALPNQLSRTNYAIDMDIGVGAFIVSSAIVSAPARQARRVVGTKRAQSDGKPTQSFVQKLYAFLRPIVLVLVFGVARFLTVKGVNYQEHVSEYGVHWNFYFTLAGVYLVYSFFRAFGKWASGPAVAVLIACGMQFTCRRCYPLAPILTVDLWHALAGYQVFLSQFGGEDYILNEPRDNLLSQNREGILSLAGELI